MNGILGSQDPLLWYVNRSTGLVLLVLLTLTVAVGVLSSRRGPGSRVTVPRFVPQAVHRSLGLLTLLLLAVHVASAVVDEYVDIRWWHAVVPLGLHYQPAWLAVGVVTSDLLLAVVLTSLVRGRLRHGHWRAVHLTTYAAWGGALVHGVGIGTDTGLTPVIWLYVGCAAVVGGALTHRLRSAGRLHGPASGARPTPGGRPPAHLQPAPALPRRPR